jgi:hypothetical protein
VNGEVSLTSRVESSRIMRSVIWHWYQKKPCLLDCPAFVIIALACWRCHPWVDVYRDPKEVW